MQSSFKSEACEVKAGDKVSDRLGPLTSTRLQVALWQSRLRIPMPSRSGEVLPTVPRDSRILVFRPFSRAPNHLQKYALHRIVVGLQFSLDRRCIPIRSP